MPHTNDCGNITFQYCCRIQPTLSSILAASLSRTEIEEKLEADLKGKRVKIGDFNASDYTFTQSVSRLVYTATTEGGQKYVGLANASAESRRASSLASRRSVLTRSPGLRGMSDGATITQSIPRRWKKR
jgi:hypothetical protein